MSAAVGWVVIRDHHIFGMVPLSRVYDTEADAAKAADRLSEHGTVEVVEVHRPRRRADSLNVATPPGWVTP